MRKEDKNTALRIFLILFVLLMAGVASWYFYSRDKAADTEEAKEETATTEPLSDKQEQPEAEPDHEYLLNGYWKSESTEDDRFLEFTVNYPKVENFNGIFGKLEALDNYKFNYRLTFIDENGTSTFYIGSLEGDSALVWYEDEDGNYTNSLILNRDPEIAPDNVIVSPTDHKPDSSQSTANSKPSSSSGNSSGNNTSNNPGSSNSGKTGHYEERQVCVEEAYDEKVLVKKGECTSVCVQEAYDTQEMVYLDGAFYGPDQELKNWCYICDHLYDDHCHQEAHPSTTVLVDVSEPYWHNIEYRSVHHDAVYENRCEPDEYKTVHHDAVYETQMVWVED